MLRFLLMILLKMHHAAAPTYCTGFDQQLPSKSALQEQDCLRPIMHSRISSLVLVLPVLGALLSGAAGTTAFHESRPWQEQYSKAAAILRKQQHGGKRDLGQHTGSTK
jgi:hypothetical protein